MKKVRRITKNQEFGDILSCRKFTKTPSFILYRKEAKENHARIGISAGKKLGNDVVRNKVKRKVRSLIDEVFDFDEPWDLVLIVRPGYLKNDYAQLKNELSDARRKALKSSAKRGK